MSKISPTVAAMALAAGTALTASTKADAFIPRPNSGPTASTLYMNTASADTPAIIDAPVIIPRNQPAAGTQHPPKNASPDPQHNPQGFSTKEKQNNSRLQEFESGITTKTCLYLSATLLGLFSLWEFPHSRKNIQRSRSLGQQPDATDRIFNAVSGVAIAALSIGGLWQMGAKITASHSAAQNTAITATVQGDHGKPVSSPDSQTGCPPQNGKPGPRPDPALVKQIMQCLYPAAP